MKRKKKAFTLTELLVVVIVIGVLSSVVLPKFSKVVETRKTTEAEELMAAVRTEQEKRCTLDKNYVTNLTAVQEIVPGRDTKNFAYSLTRTGMEAASKGKYGYTLKMPSYKDGRICCENAEECAKLNKDYPLCSELIAKADYQNGEECEGELPETPSEPEPQGPCDTDPSSCECRPNQAKCCTADQKWENGACVAKTFCDVNPDDCSCNPNQEKCCTSNEVWENGTCRSKTACETDPCSCPNADVEMCCNSDEDFYLAHLSQCCQFFSIADTQDWSECCYVGYGAFHSYCCSNGYFDDAGDCWETVPIWKPIDKKLRWYMESNDELGCLTTYPLNEYKDCGECTLENQGEICRNMQGSCFIGNIVSYFMTNEGLVYELEASPLEECTTETDALF